MAEQQGQGHYITVPPGNTGATGAKSGQSAQDVARESNSEPVGSAGSGDPTAVRFAPNG